MKHQDRDFQDPIELSSFRLEAARNMSQAMEKQFRLSFGLAALLFAATAAIAMSGMV